MDLLDYIDKTSRSALEINKDNLKRIVSDCSQTAFGRDHGFGSVHSPQDYINAVSAGCYSSHAPYIEKYLSGDETALTAYTVNCNLLSSGSSGNRKRFLLTDEALRRYSSYWYEVPFWLQKQRVRKEFHVGAYRKGEGVHNDTILSAAFYWNLKNNGTLKEENIAGGYPFMFVDGLESMLYLKARLFLSCEDLSAIISNYLYDLTVFFAYIRDNFDMLYDDIRKRDFSVPVPEHMRKTVESLPHPDEKRLMAFRDVFFEDKDIRTLFPSLGFVSGIGGSVYRRHTQSLRKILHDTPVYYYTYASSECKMGVPISFDRSEYILLADTAFYEFADLKEDRIIPMEDLREGMSVSPVVTTFSGLYRYVVNDELKVTGFHNQSPLFTVEGRVDDIINLAGEKLGASVFQDAMGILSERTGVIFSDYALAFDFSSTPACYRVYVEATGQKEIQKLSSSLHSILQELDSEYEDVCRFSLLAPPRFCLLEEGTLRAMRSSLFKGGHNKASFILRQDEAEYLAAKENS